MRVLIADDQKGVGTTLAGLVESCGHEVVQVVGSGLEAIQAYTRFRPDVVLMDFFMPRLNGATACRMILSKHPEAKIVIVTGNPAAAEQAATGAVSILPKPVDLNRLYGALYDAAPQRSRPAEPPHEQSAD
ncbi:MAG: response regulator transcription factor [Chthoniobacterales bacterium]|nr:response regulator transcription factor [Chthoniobacterales bacterium]